MNFSNQLFRCSSLGYLMTEPKGKSNFEKWEEACINLGRYRSEYENIKNKETKTAAKKLEQISKTEAEVNALEPIRHTQELAETVKTHLVDVYVSAVYGRKTEITSKFLEKGLMVEEDSITLYSRATKTFFLKNEEHLSNDFIMGTPDLYTGSDVHHADLVIDVKSSWDIFTYHRAATAPMNKMYYWQLQGYMWLTGAQRAKLVYCLVNTPEKLINDEKRKMFYASNSIDPDTDWSYMEACADLDKALTYDDIPIDKRYFTFEVERNDEDLKALQDRVIRGREFLGQLHEKFYPALLKEQV